MRTILERFEQLWMPEPMSGCWLWIGSLRDKSRADYGAFLVNGRLQRAHRVSYALYKGPIPDGLFVCHHCDMPSCVNPDHLFLGTAGDNNADRTRKGRGARGQQINTSRLTPELVRAIRAAPSSRKGARLAGVSHPHAVRIRNGSSWGHLT